MDSTQFIIYLTHISIELTKDGSHRVHDSHLLWGNVVAITCLLMCTVKLMQFLRYNEDFSFLIQMILTVFVDLFPFMTVFFVLVFFFSLVMVIADADFDNDDYDMVDRFIQIFLQVFRNSVGDIAATKYEHWMADSSGATQTTAMFLIWFFWLFNIFIMLIVMLNFLIAEVSQTYDKVKGQGKMLLYQKKAELNLLACKIFRMFGKRTAFKVLVFTTPK